jgi:HAE1 family hydrophobic/amphiphilic exporter-1
MTSLISLALHRKVSTLMLFLALFFLGGVLSLGLNWDLYPRIKSPSLLVTSSYPGLPAEQIRELLTIPLEDSLSTLQGLKNLSSRSEDNAVLIELSFEWGTDMVQRGIETREKLDLAYLSLPQGASKPFLIPVDPNSEPIILLSLRPKDGDLSFVKALAEREVKSLLTQISGVGQVISFGGTQNEVKVIVDPRLLAGRGLTYEILLQTLTENLGDFLSATSLTVSGTTWSRPRPRPNPSKRSRISRSWEHRRELHCESGMWRRSGWEKRISAPASTAL